jgi:hypothetical protein
MGFLELASGFHMRVSDENEKRAVREPGHRAYVVWEARRMGDPIAALWYCGAYS